MKPNPNLTPDMEASIKKMKAHQRRHRESPINEAMRTFIDRLRGKHRLHLSKKKINRLQVEYPPDQHDYKPAIFSVEKREPTPTGFWWGINGSWADWCLCAEFRGSEKYFYELELDPKCLRVITTLKEFEDFEEEFSCGPPWEQDERLAELMRPFRRHRGLLRMDYIDWPAVAEQYAGVEINPYLYQKRLESHWYYGWDCASGVLWDINVVKEFRLFAAYNSDSKRFERAKKS
jgi:hypothetical protein